MEYLIYLNKLIHPCTTEGHYSSAEVSARTYMYLLFHRVDKNLLFSVCGALGSYFSSQTPAKADKALLAVFSLPPCGCC